MKTRIITLLIGLASIATYAATPVANNQQNTGFDQAADTLGVGTQTYAPHLSSSAIKTPPNDNADDVIQNGVNTSSS